MAMAAKDINSQIQESLFEILIKSAIDDLNKILDLNNIKQTREIKIKQDILIRLLTDEKNSKIVI